MFYKDTEMIVSNISVGGVLIVDDTEVFGTEIGEIVMITLQWDDFSTKIRSKVVGANQQYDRMYDRDECSKRQAIEDH